MSTLPLTYYVQFRNPNGSIVTGAGGQTWFAADQLGFDTELASTLGEQTKGKESFDPLTFTIGNDTSLPPLFQRTASGTGFVQVEVAGYSGTGSTATLVTDDVFKQALVGTDTPDASGTTLSLQYGDVVQRSYADTDGTVPLTNTQGYNLVTMEPDTGNGTVSGTSGYAPAAPLTGTPAAVPASTPLTYYVQFRQADGTALANASGQTWFAVTALSSSESTPVTMASGSSGLAAGQVTFGPLTFTLAGGDLPSLLAAQLTNPTFSAVELAGYDGTGALATLTADEVFKNAQITTLTTGADGSQTLSIRSDDEVQAAYPASLAGVLTPSVNGGWNTALNVSDTSSDAKAARTSPAAATGGPLTYYVQFRNAAGTVLAGNGGDTWFAANDLSFSTNQTAGSVSVGPLSFSLLPDSIRTALFAQQAAGHVGTEVEVAGYDAAGTLVQDDAFTDARLTTDTLLSDGTATLSFTPLGLSTSGAAGSVTTVASSNDTVTPAFFAGAAPPVTAASPGALTYYVQFHTASGAVLTSSGGATWFAVTGVGFGSNQTFGSDPAASGKLTFDNLTFTLGNTTILPGLFEQEAAGNPFATIELAGYSGSGTTAQLVQDDVFKGVSIAAETATSTGTTVFAHVAAYLDNTYSDGSLAATAGWSTVTNSADDTNDGAAGLPGNAPDAPLSQTPPTGTLPGPLTEYVQFHTSSGAVLTTPAGASWFAITGVELPTSKPVSLGTGEGTSSIVNFGAASFTLLDPTVGQQLLVDEAEGTPLAYVEIAGYNGDDASADLVQDSVLKFAAVSSISAPVDGSQVVGLEYAGRVDRAYALSTDGTQSTPTIGGWDRVDNKADTSDASLGGVADTTASPLAPLQGVPASSEVSPPLSFYAGFATSGGTHLQDSTGASYFQVSGIEVGTQQTLDIGSDGGTGAGKIAFDPVTITLAPNSLLPTLFADQAASTYINVELAGYDTAGTTPERLEDFQFIHALPVSITANADGSETLAFDYEALDENTTGASGGSTTPEGWDQVKNQMDSSGSAFATAPVNSLPDTTPVCYCPGTSIAVPGGEVRIETLRPGDLVLTADGRSLPVLWIGRRSYGRRFVAARPSLLPVTIAAGALGQGVPTRDLRVSPEHAMLIEGMLVPARCLLNGHSITQDRSAADVHYLHVELERHEAIVAEGAPSESFIDDDNRGVFHNAQERTGAHRPGPAEYCAPRVEGGAILEAIRRRLDAVGTQRAA